MTPYRPILLATGLLLGCQSPHAKPGQGAQVGVAQLALAGDAGIASRPTGEPARVGLGEQCLSPALTHMMRGTCQPEADACEGGYPDALILSDMFPEQIIRTFPIAPAPHTGPLPAPPQRAANCGDGLVCCLGTDQCDGFRKEFASQPGLDFLVSSVTCVEPGQCEGVISGEVALGCPGGQSCCVRNF